MQTLQVPNKKKLIMLTYHIILIELKVIQVKSNRRERKSKGALISHLRTGHDHHLKTLCVLHCGSTRYCTTSFIRLKKVLRRVWPALLYLNPLEFNYYKNIKRQMKLVFDAQYGNIGENKWLCQIVLP